MKKVYCMWCLKNQPSKLSKSTGKILCAVCENSAVGIARRPTRRAADDYNAVPTIIKSFPMRDAYPVGHKNRRR
jgi:hypothetical protein